MDEQAGVCTCSVHPLHHVRSHEADVSVPVDNVANDLWFEKQSVCGGEYTLGMPQLLIYQ